MDLSPEIYSFALAVLCNGVSLQLNEQRRKLMIGLRVRFWFAGMVFLLSGTAGLGSQIVWAKMLALGLGHEMPSTLAVLAALMGGMALGAWTLDGVVSRSGHPGLYYAGLEIVIGIWSAALACAMPLVNHLALILIGLGPSLTRHWTAAFVVPFTALLPATFAMGATFPAMERFVAPLERSGRCVGILYGLNTFGAAGGALASVFLFMPTMGLSKAAFTFAGLNLFGGVLVGLLAKPVATGETAGKAPFTRRRKSREPRSQAVEGAVAARWTRHWRPTATLFATGLLGIAYEVLVVRTLSQVLENTVYTYVAVLSVYLMGAALGAGIYARFFRVRSAQSLSAILFFALACACVLGIAVLPHSKSLYSVCRTAWGDTALAVALAEMVVATTPFLLPTVLMGATFSHLVQHAKQPTGGIGRAVALNTFGGSAAPFLFGVILLPAIGSKWALLTVALGYLPLMPEFPGRRWWPIAFLMGLLAMTWSADLRMLDLPGRAKVIDFREGTMAAVSVLEDGNGERTLRVNNRFQMGGTATAPAERRHAHIPLLLHPHPQRALFLGLGTGITFGATAVHPHLKAEGVELLPEVIKTMEHFSAENGEPWRLAQLRIFVADARRFVRATDQTYDVIVADLFHPAMDGAGALYTRQHFQAIRGRLSPAGLFCQWLPLHQLDESMLRVITRTFVEVFPHAHAYLLRFNVDTPVIGLIGFLEPLKFSTGWVEGRLEHVELRTQLRQLVLTDSLQLFGCLLADSNDLKAFAAGAAENTDDRPRVIFDAPRGSYRQQAPHERLFALLALWRPDLRGVFADSSDDNEQLIQRVQNFMAARNLYLEGLAAEAQQRLGDAVNLYVSSSQSSADFTWSYARCIKIANLFAKTNPAEARTLLERLVAAQPAQQMARDFLKQLQIE